jgi:hypothetical protein
MMLIEVSLNAKEDTNQMQRPDWNKTDWAKAREQLKERSWINEINGMGAADAWARF